MEICNHILERFLTIVFPIFLRCRSRCTGTAYPQRWHIQMCWEKKQQIRMQRTNQFVIRFRLSMGINECCRVLSSALHLPTFNEMNVRDVNYAFLPSPHSRTMNDSKITKPSGGKSSQTKMTVYKTSNHSFRIGVCITLESEVPSFLKTLEEQRFRPWRRKRKLITSMPSSCVIFSVDGSWLCCSASVA